MWPTVLSFAIEYWKPIVAIVYSLSLVFIGYKGHDVMINGRHQNEGTRTVYVDAPYDLDELTTFTLPNIDVRYEPVLNQGVIDSLQTANDSLKRQIGTRVKTVTDTLIMAPTGLERFDLAPTNPVEVSGREVTITTFNTKTYQWQERKYRTQPPAWDWSLTAGAFYDPIGKDYVGEVTGSLQYRSVGLEATVGHLVGNTSYVMAGVTYEIVSR